jgi:hypothetical protein
VILLHGHQTKSEQIFASQDVDPWKMVDFLMQIHAKKSVRFYLSISPPYIPIARSLIFLDDPSKFFSYFFDDGVLSIRDIDDNFFSLGFLSKFGDWYIFRGVVCVQLD